jgi:hypothetical protein
MNYWDERLALFTPEEYEQLPDGTELYSIGGKKLIKGKDYIDQDTRFGYLAVGVVDPWDHPLKDLFLTFKLKQKY